MRKLIIFLLLISFSIFGRKYYVPEEFSTLQQGISFANDFDTISVFFGRELGKKEIVGMDIFGKKLIFEIRGGEKEMFLEEMKNFLNNLPQRDNRNRQYPPPGWQGLKGVCEPDRLLDFSWEKSAIAFTDYNQPWVVWTGRPLSPPRNLEVYCTYWNWKKQNWDGDKIAIPLPGPERWDAIAPKITIYENHPYIICNIIDPYNRNDIYYTRYNGFEWEPKRMVNLFDSTEYDFRPCISAKGGQLWANWFGGSRDDSIYSIYSTKWNGNGWTEEEVISFDDNYHDWFQQLAVDSRGNPHVVWIALDIFPPYEDVIFYRYYDGNRWSEPETVCKGLLLQRGFYWAFTTIELDEGDNPHVIFDAILVPSSQSEVFYATKKEGKWGIVRITYDQHRDIMSTIGVFNSSNIWLGWTQMITSYDGILYLRFYNGREFSEIINLETPPCTSYLAWINDLKYDFQGNLWVIIYANPKETPSSDVWYDVYFSPTFIKEFSINNFKIKRAILSSYRSFNFFQGVEIYNKMGERINFVRKKGVYFLIKDKRIRIPLILLN
ncbi:MAG: hypothetical protein ABIK90_03645 [candidate division WOR-3 bacterium]